MILHEVPPPFLLGWGGLWLPYAERIARREGCDVFHYLAEALNGEARIFVICGADGRPTGAVATRFLLRNGTTRVGELHWLAGDGMRDWLPVCFPQLEQILVRDHGVTVLKTTGRPGLERAFAPFGYRRKKVILEKVIA